MPQNTPPGPAPDPKTAPSITRRTMAELGPTLPVGVGTPPARAIEVRPWRMKEERELGDLRERNRDANFASHVSLALGHMCPVLGQPLAPMREAERRFHLGQMFMGDVLYAYCWLRREAMGSLLDLSLTCPSCRAKFSFQADLDTLEVDCAESALAAQWEYRLKKPITVRGKTLEGFVLGPARWSAMESVRLGTGLGSAKPVVVRASVVDMVGEGLSGSVIADHEMDELMKVDVESLTTLIDRYSVGPNMSVEAQCTRCAHEFKTSIDWSFGSFFSSSSQ